MSSLVLNSSVYTSTHIVALCWYNNLNKAWIPGDGHYNTPGYVTSGMLKSTFPPVKINEHTSNIDFLETPFAQYQDNQDVKPTVQALPEQWPFNHPHFRISLPIPESVMAAFAYKAVLLEVYVGITPSTDVNKEKATVDPDDQEYQADAKIWDFQVDVGRIASIASQALLQRLIPHSRQLRYKALIYMIMYAPIPNATFDLTFRLVCKTTNAYDYVVYKHNVITDYILSSMGLNQRVPHKPPVGWTFVPSEDASDDDF